MDKLDDLRKAMGTLPSAQPCERTMIVRGCSNLSVEMVPGSGPENPYRAIVEAACATWGDNNYKAKWPQLDPVNRFRVVLAVLTRNTLPQAVEPPKWTWVVKGAPRHAFDQHARARVGTTFFSVGCRDNSKLDADFILYSKLYDAIVDENYPHSALEIGTLGIDSAPLTPFGQQAVKALLAAKQAYKETLNLSDGRGSWQMARAFLPMSYHHPYHFSMNLLALQGQCARRMQFCEEEFIVGIHWLLRETIAEKFPLIANYLRPGCDFAKKCTYSKNYELSNAFGCLFASCGRHPAGTEYATFNQSCTDKTTLERQLGIFIPHPDEWVKYTIDDYNKLSDKDKDLFESA